MTSRTYYRLGAAVALLTALFLVWSIGALGIIGEGGKPDRMYLGVLLTLVVGAAAARLRPRGMAYALVATATAQVVVAVVALATGQQDTPGASTAGDPRPHRDVRRALRPVGLALLALGREPGRLSRRGGPRGASRATARTAHTSPR